MFRSLFSWDVNMAPSFAAPGGRRLGPRLETGLSTTRGQPGRPGRKGPDFASDC